MKLKKYSQGNKDSPSSPHISSCSTLGKVKRTVRPCDTNTDWLAQHIWEAPSGAVCKTKVKKHGALVFRGSRQRNPDSHTLAYPKTGQRGHRQGPCSPSSNDSPMAGCPSSLKGGLYRFDIFPSERSFLPSLPQPKQPTSGCLLSKQKFVSFFHSI